MADDLHLPIEHATRDARNYQSEHPAVKTFVQLRESAPGVGEPITDVRPKGKVLSLHVGAGRAATVYDAEQDVVWLLAYSPTHATGERRDGYRKFMRLDERDELLPTDEDYESVEGLSSVAILDAFEVQCRAIYAEARMRPGDEVSGVVLLSNGQKSGVVAAVDVQIVGQDNIEQGWVAFNFPADTRLSTSQVLDLLVAVLPEGVEPERAADINGRQLKHYELGWTWVIYPSDSL